METAKSITVDSSFINERLGIDLPAADMQRLLTNVEFTVNLHGETLEVTAPFWRTDIAIPEDIVEEVGRLYGYDKLPLTLPQRDLTAAQRNPQFELKQRVRDTLSRAGANELLTYSFVHGNLLDKVGQDKEQAFQLSNALSPDLQYYRMSLMPSLLDKVHPNSKAGYDEMALFEIGKTHIKNLPDNDEPEIPKEMQSVALVFAANAKAAKQYQGAAYYQAKKYLETLLADFNLDRTYSYEPVSDKASAGNPWLAQLVMPYEPNRSAVICDAEGHIWGVVGEFRKSVSNNLKLPEFTAGFELAPRALMSSTQKPTYLALPRFPKVEQDITLRVSTDVAFSGLEELLTSELSNARPDQTYCKLTPLGIYQKDDDHKNISFRLEIASYERTLTAEEVNKLLDTVAAAAHNALQAERV